MTYSIKQSFKHAVGITFFLSGIYAKAQVSLVQNTIDKLKGYKNFSYEFTNKRLDNTIDTTINHNKQLFLKAPTDTIFGYFFKLELVYKTEKLVRTDLYNGKNQICLFPENRTYETQKIRPAIFTQTLLGNLNWIKNFVEKKPSKLVRAADTTINGLRNIHLILTTRDTFINKEHYYTLKHLLLDKRSGMPAALITISRSNYTGNGISDYYDEIRYSDYKFNQPNIGVPAFRVPKEYHLRKNSASIALLSPGIVAPDWTLFDANDNKISFSQLKGKVVLLDFYFIGCTGCMASLKPLDALHQKYKDKDFVIASISERDKKQAVISFEKRYNINYHGYLNGGSVVKSYHVTAFPTFYFIDKEGKIAKVFVGYSDDFEAKAIAIIENLLIKQ
jgi:peroxiredoxin